MWVRRTDSSTDAFFPTPLSSKPFLNSICVVCLSLLNIYISFLFLKHTKKPVPGGLLEAREG